MGLNSYLPAIHMELFFGGESSRTPPMVVAMSTSAMHSVVELVHALSPRWTQVCVVPLLLGAECTLSWLHYSPFAPCQWHMLITTAVELLI